MKPHRVAPKIRPMVLPGVRWLERLSGPGHALHHGCSFPARSARGVSGSFADYSTYVVTTSNVVGSHRARHTPQLMCYTSLVREGTRWRRPVTPRSSLATVFQRWPDVGRCSDNVVRFFTT